MGHRRLRRRDTRRKREQNRQVFSPEENGSHLLCHWKEKAERDLAAYHIQQAHRKKSGLERKSVWGGGGVSHGLQLKKERKRDPLSCGPIPDQNGLVVQSLTRMTH